MYIVIRFSFLFIVLISALQLGTAQQNNQILQEAMTNAKSGDNQKAIEKFEALESHSSREIRGIRISQFCRYLL